MLEYKKIFFFLPKKIGGKDRKKINKNAGKIIFTRVLFT